MIKEFATLKAAALAGCDLCMDIGSIVAARSGVIERQLLTLHDHTTSPAVDDRERLVVDLLVGMTATPAGGRGRPVARPSGALRYASTKQLAASSTTAPREHHSSPILGLGPRVRAPHPRARALLEERRRMVPHG